MLTSKKRPKEKVLTEKEARQKETIRLIMERDSLPSQDNIHKTVYRDLQKMTKIMDVDVSRKTLMDFVSRIIVVPNERYDKIQKDRKTSPRAFVHTLQIARTKSPFIIIPQRTINDPQLRRSTMRHEFLHYLFPANAAMEIPAYAVEMTETFMNKRIDKDKAISERMEKVEAVAGEDKRYINNARKGIIAGRIATQLRANLGEEAARFFLRKLLDKSRKRKVLYDKEILALVQETEKRFT